MSRTWIAAAPCTLCTLLMLSALCLARPAIADEVRVVDAPPAGRSFHYVANREPLAPSPLAKLPIGSIEPRGWLRAMLELQRDGMVGRLPEISRWCNFEGNSWADPQGRGHSGWEEMPYWLKGYGDMAHVLRDEKALALTKRWVDSILRTQREDGYFGPRMLLTSLDKARDGSGGRPDLWPHMIVLNILQSWHEATGDERVIPFMTKYFRWQLDFPEKDFMAGYWPKMRIGDNVESIHWLYNRTGERWLLDVAAKVHRNGARWDEDVINWHGVNFCQGFREPTVFWAQSLDPAHRAGAERNYRKMMGLYGQVPGGMFGADEVARPGFADPRQGAETCSMVEFMHSFQMLTKLTGESVWADRCEEVAFNSLPAALTPDMRALHYLTAANQVSLDRHNKAPGIMNRGTMFSYSPYEVYRCCQHNVAHGWPYYAEELVLATSDRGLCASLYADSVTTAKVGEGAGTTIRLDQRTEYPFSEVVSFTITIPDGATATFPLYLRIPRWCQGAAVLVNGTDTRAAPAPGKFVAIDRAWKGGDTVQLRLPMRLAVRTWKENHDSVSVDYGPLTFSLLIKEKWQRYGRPGPWAEHEVLPDSPWNYGLVYDPKKPADEQFEVHVKAGPLPAGNPWTHENVNISLRAKARKIPRWTTDANNLVETLQASPAKTSEPVEEVTLIPMGAARLRISAFPNVTDGPEGKVWTKRVPPTASHVFEGDTTLALNDGRLPKASDDKSIPRFTWWPRRGSAEWVQYTFDAPRKVSAAEVYWFDDTGTGQCRVPASWRVLYRAGEEWKEVEARGPYGTARDAFNRVTFEPVETTAIRVEARLQAQFSAGILEWRVE